MYHRVIEEREAKAQQLRALDFPEELEWMNSKPLSLNTDLRGKVVPLLFWSSDCIHSLQTLQHLKHSCEHFGRPEIVPILVHVGRSAERMQAALSLANLPFAAVHDPARRLAKDYNVSSVPLLVVISPKGNILEAFLGESWRYELGSLLADCLLYYKDELSSDPVPTTETNPTNTFLLQPSAVLAKPEGLFVSDTGHRRVVELGWDGRRKRSFERGLREPRGLCVHDNKLIVADSGAHALLAFNLDDAQTSAEPTLLAGGGGQGYDYSGDRELELSLLSAPWGLAGNAEQLFISMAGTHQIWTYDWKSQCCRAIAGTGAQMGLDAQSQEAASFAWPTGLSLSKDSLFVADRNSHRVRKLSLEAKSCSSIIGAGSDPYTLCPQGVLEYPCDVEWIPDLEILAVAELCHPQVLLWDPKDQSTRNLAIESGAIPSGLSYSPEHQSLVISSTNKSTLTIIHLGTGEEKELDPS